MIKLSIKNPKRLLLSLIPSISAIFITLFLFRISASETPPVLYWKFDEGSGTTAYDTTTNTNNGTISGAVYNIDGTAGGKKSQSLQFDGVNDYVSKTYSADTELDPGTSDFEISVWVKTGGSENQQNIVSRFNGAGYKLYISSTGLPCFGIDDDNTWDTADLACSTTSVFDSMWHHISGVRSGSSIILYVDGVSKATDSSLTETGSLSGTSPNFYLGIDSDAASNVFLGLIDEVRFFNTSRTAAKVKNEFASKGSYAGAAAIFGTGQEAVDTNGLAGYWKMDEASWTNDCSTYSVIDSSGNGNNAKACPATTGPTGVGNGKYGYSGDFDGSDDYLQIKDNNGLSPSSSLSVASWINPDAVASEQTIIGKWNEQEDKRAWRIYVSSSGKLCGAISSSGTSGTVYEECTSASLTAATYSHVVMTVGMVAGYLDINLYVNKTLQSTTTSGSQISSINTN